MCGINGCIHNEKINFSMDYFILQTDNIKNRGPDQFVYEEYDIANINNDQFVDILDIIIMISIILNNDANVSFFGIIIVLL